MKEYIICSAIWYKSQLWKPVYQVKNIDYGLVLCGRRHHNIIEIAKLLGGISTKDNTEQGFLTNTDRFVDRREAYDIAVAANQIINKYKTNNELYSEDIY